MLLLSYYSVDTMQHQSGAFTQRLNLGVFMLEEMDGEMPHCCSSLQSIQFEHESIQLAKAT